MDQTPMMKCGHAANATSDGKPCCVICAPDPKAFEIDEHASQNALIGRKAMCTYCGKTVPSNTNLPFFSRGKGEFDRYYCGCRGWS